MEKDKGRVVNIELWMKDLTIDKQVELMSKIPDIEFDSPFLVIHVDKDFFKNNNGWKDIIIPYFDE